MPEISVSEKILSEDYADLILPVTLSGSYFLNAYMQMGGELLGGNYGVIHVPLSSLPRDLLAYVGYYNIPKLYTLLDESSLEASGILKVRSQPLLGYTGKDVILGFLDTGIDYTQPIFRRSDGRSRIVGLWDQTDQTGTPPENSRLRLRLHRGGLKPRAYRRRSLLRRPFRRRKRPWNHSREHRLWKRRCDPGFLRRGSGRGYRRGKT